jgi:hypothetical protein
MAANQAFPETKPENALGQRLPKRIKPPSRICMALRLARTPPGIQKASANQFCFCADASLSPSAVMLKAIACAAQAVAAVEIH